MFAYSPRSFGNWARGPVRGLCFLQDAPTLRTNVYIDGFNLYYGALKGTSFKWLDVNRLCELLLPQHSIERIRYFTALVSPRPPDMGQRQRQEVYLRAVQTIPNLSVHYGSFLVKKKRRPLVTPLPGGRRTAEVFDTEEKGSDVNLATYLLRDGFQGEYEVAVVVSNDSDLVHAIEIVRDELSLSVGLLNPHKRPSVRLKPVATFYKPIRGGVLKASQFPNPLHDSHGIITKPADW